jgi:hypothetical protein
MSQAEPASTSIGLTKKGERAIAEQSAARALAIAEKQRIYREAGDQVVRLLDILDRLADDPDLEDGGDAEPGNDEELSLGWAGHVNQTSRHCHGECDQHFGDRELDRCDDEDTGDLEPSLGGYGGGGYEYDSEADPCDSARLTLAGLTSKPNRTTTLRR